MQSPHCQGRYSLLLEEYFGDANRDKLHPTRSHTKSMTSFVVGKAIELGKNKERQRSYPQVPV